MIPANCRRTVALVVSCAVLFVAAIPGMAVSSSQQLGVRLEGDFLRIVAPHFSFLSGKPLERLKEGGSVAFIGQVSVSTGPNTIDARSVARFALSYDIWEERFSVTKIGLDSRRTVSHLSAAATEAWCLENLAIDRNQIPPDKPFFVSLDLRAEDPRDQNGVIGDPGINITRLIEVFSRPARGQQPKWLISGGPYTVADLKKNEVHSVRGARG